MTDAWNDMRKAKEGDYFRKKNEDALKRMKEKQSEKARLSPITGEKMEQVVLHGVVIDRCPTSGGIWLDAGELEQLVEAMAGHAEKSESSSWISHFFKDFTGGK